MEWGVTVVNASFLADIIHSKSLGQFVCSSDYTSDLSVDGQVPAVLFPRHTEVGQPHEFLPSHCFEASRLLSETPPSLLLLPSRFLPILM